MGFTKKSLLALVLALVMLSGMAIPTAFAADVKPTPITFWTNAATPIDLNVAAEPGTGRPAAAVGTDTAPFEVKMIGSNTDKSLSKLLFSQAAAGDGLKVTATSSNPGAVEVSVVEKAAADGDVTSIMKVTPKAATLDPVEISVSVTGATKTAFEDKYDIPLEFAGTFIVTFKPQIKSDTEKVSLALNSADMVKVLSITANTADDVTLTAPPTLSPNVTVVELDKTTPSTAVTVSANGKYLTVSTNGVVGEGFIKLTDVPVDTNPASNAQILYIPFSVGDATANKPYKVKVNKAAWEVTADQLNTIAITAQAVDTAGNVVPEDPIPTGGYPTFDIGSVEVVSAEPSTGSITITGPNSFNEFTVPYNSYTEGVFKVRVIGHTPNILSDEVTITIKPVTATAAPAAPYVDTNQQAADNGQSLNKTTFKISASNGKRIAYASAAFTAPATLVGLTGTPIVAKTDGQFEVTIPAGFPKTKGTITITGILDESGNTVKDIEVPFEVRNTLAAPKLTPNQSTVLITRNVADTVNLTFTPTNFYPATPAIVAADITDVAVVSKDSTTANVAGSALAWQVQGLKVGTTKLTVNGKVKGFPIDEYTIDVTVQDTTPGVANKIVANPASVQMKATDFNKVLTYYQVDAAGTRLGPDPAAWLGVSATLDDVRGEPLANTILGAPSVNTATGEVTISVLGVGGTANLKLSATGVPDLLVPVTVSPVNFATTTTNIALDLMSVNDAKTTVTLTSTDGTLITNIPTIVSGGTGTMTFTQKSTGVWEIVATAVGKGKLRFTGTVNGIGATPIEIPYEIKNSTGFAFSPAKEKLEFDLKDQAGSVQILNVVAQPLGSPANVPVITSVTSSNTALLTASFTGLRVTLTAVGAGEGVLTVSGTVNGKPAKDLVVPFKVVGVSTGDLRVTPDPITLSMASDAAKTVTLTVAGSVTTDVVANAAIDYTGDVLKVEGLKLTALKVGSGTVTVKADVNGVAKAKVVNFTVSEVPLQTGIGIKLDDTLIKPTGRIALQYGSTPAINDHQYTLWDYATGTPVTTGAPFKWSSSSSRITFHSETSTAKNSITGTTKSTGNTTVTVTDSNGTKYTQTFGITKLAATSFDVAAPTIDMIVGQKIPAGALYVPAGARGKGFTYRSSDKTVATVKANGIITARAAGAGKSATITIKSKNDGFGTKQVVVNVKSNFESVVFRSIMLVQDTATQTNSSAAGIKAALDAAKYSATATAIPTVQLPSAATAAQVIAAIQAIAADTAVKSDDVTTFYFAGENDGAGLKLAGGEKLTLYDLAIELAKIQGNVVVYLDMTFGNRMLNTKDVTVADVQLAFAKATATLTRLGDNRFKFRVFTATEKQTRKPEQAAGTATTFSSKFSDGFVNALKVGTDGISIAADTNKDGYVSVAEMNKALKAATTYARVFTDTTNTLPVYGLK